MEFKRNQGDVICSLKNELIASNVQEMRDELINYLDSNPNWEKFILDCQDIETLDSIGVNLIVGLYKKALAANKGFEIIGCNEAIFKVLKLFRLDEQFTVKEK